MRVLTEERGPQRASKSQKAVVVDGPNLYFALKGEGRQIDYEALRQSLLGEEEGRAIYVSFLSPDPQKAEKHQAFLEALRKKGWEVRQTTEPARYGKERGVDVLVALALVELAGEAQEVCLVSGDKDLVPAVRAAQGLGARVVVVAPQGVIAQALAEAADEVRLI